VSIASIDRHSIAGVISTHDPWGVALKSKMGGSCLASSNSTKETWLLTEFRGLTHAICWKVFHHDVEENIISPRNFTLTDLRET